MSEILQLLGGPRDGQLVDSEVEYAPREYLIVLPPDLMQWIREGSGGGDLGPDYRLGVYRPDRDESGFIHRTDVGELIYLWKGIRDA